MSSTIDTTHAILVAQSCGQPGCVCAASLNRGHGRTHCPSHSPDSDPSLNVTETPDGKTLVHCFGGCTQDEVVTALRERGVWGSVTPPNGRHAQASRPATARRVVRTTRYEARNPDGSLFALKERDDFEDGKKTFRWLHPDGRVSRRGEIPSATAPLYGIELVQEATRVILAEGERAKDALAALHLPAVATMTGSSTVPNDDVLETIVGKETIFLWPDNDAAGRKHMHHIAERLTSLGATVVRVVDWPDAPVAGDAADFITTTTTPADVKRLLAAAQPWQPGQPPAPAAADGPHLVIRPVTDYQTQPIIWQWPGWLARGELHVYAGVEGDGKGISLSDIIARLSRGGEMPDGTFAPESRVLLLAAEDSPERTIRPRLERHGATMANIFIVEAIREPGKADRAFSLARHMEMLTAAVVEYRIDVLVIDPLSAFLQKSDRNSEGEVRDLLMPVVALTRQTDVSVIGVGHLNRPNGASRRPTQRILGSTAFGAVARVVWMIAPAGDEQDPTRRWMGVVKSNLAMKPAALEWSLPYEDAPIQWHGISTRGIDEILAGGSERGESPERVAVKAAIIAAGRALGPKDIAAALDKPEGTARWLLADMDKRGQLRRIATGMYDVPTPQTLNNANITNTVDTERIKSVGDVGDVGLFVPLVPSDQPTNACLDCGEPCGSALRCSPCAAAGVRRRA